MKKLAVITGASSGLGLDFAGIFARNQYDLIVTGRNKHALLELKNNVSAKYGTIVYVIEQDLAKPNGALALYEQIKLIGRDIDVLVNNAGFGDYGLYSSLDWTKQSDMIHVNILALMQLTHCVLPDMIRRNTGKILNLASVASFQSGPLMATYYASKAFVLHFSEAIATELKDTKITVTALCPGPTKTKFVDHANLQDSKSFRKLIVADSMPVAQYGFDMMMRGKVVAVPGLQNKLAMFGAKILPRNVVRKAVYRINQKDK